MVGGVERTAGPAGEAADRRSLEDEERVGLMKLGVVRGSKGTCSAASGTVRRRGGVDAACKQRQKASVT